MGLKLAWRNKAGLQHKIWTQITMHIQEGFLLRFHLFYQKWISVTVMFCICRIFPFRCSPSVYRDNGLTWLSIINEVPFPALTSVLQALQTNNAKMKPQWSTTNVHNEQLLFCVHQHGNLLYLWNSQETHCENFFVSHRFKNYAGGYFESFTLDATYVMHFFKFRVFTPTVIISNYNIYQIVWLCLSYIFHNSSQTIRN